jgi:hypothetical protein
MYDNIDPSLSFHQDRAKAAIVAPGVNSFASHTQSFKQNDELDVVRMSAGSLFCQLVSPEYFDRHVDEHTELTDKIRLELIKIWKKIEHLQYQSFRQDAELFLVRKKINHPECGTTFFPVRFACEHEDSRYNDHPWIYSQPQHSLKNIQLRELNKQSHALHKLYRTSVYPPGMQEIQGRVLPVYMDTDVWDLHTLGDYITFFDRVFCYNVLIFNLSHLQQLLQMHQVCVVQASADLNVQGVAASSASAHSQFAALVSLAQQCHFYTPLSGQAAFEP